MLILDEYIEDVGRWKNKISRDPEFASERNERVKILVNFCSSEENKDKVMRVSRKFRGGRYARRRAVNMKIKVENSKRCNIMADCQRLTTVTKEES